MATALSCLYWISSRGAFGNASIEKTLNVWTGSRTGTTFTVPYKGDHDLLIWYARTQSMAHCDDLDAINGKAILRREDTIIAELAVPVRRHQFQADGCGMILWTGPMGPELSYSLVIEADNVPERLAKLQASIRVDPVPDYNSLFLALGLLGAVLFLASLNCAMLSNRLRRAANSALDI
jgi:hypothetical protein